MIYDRTWNQTFDMVDTISNMPLTNLKSKIHGAPSLLYLIDYEIGSPCSEKLDLQSYLEMLWSEKGYFGLLGNNHFFLINLLYCIIG